MRKHCVVGVVLFSVVLAGCARQKVASSEQELDLARQYAHCSAFYESLANNFKSATGITHGDSVVRGIRQVGGMAFNFSVSLAQKIYGDQGKAQAFAMDEKARSKTYMDGLFFQLNGTVAMEEEQRCTKLNYAMLDAIKKSHPVAAGTNVTGN